MFLVDRYMLPFVEQGHLLAPFFFCGNSSTIPQVLGLHRSNFPPIWCVQIVIRAIRKRTLRPLPTCRDELTVGIFSLPWQKPLVPQGLSACLQSLLWFGEFGLLCQERTIWDKCEKNEWNKGSAHLCYHVLVFYHDAAVYQETKAHTEKSGERKGTVQKSAQLKISFSFVCVKSKNWACRSFNACVLFITVTVELWAEEHEKYMLPIQSVSNSGVVAMKLSYTCLAASSCFSHFMLLSTESGWVETRMYR